MTAVTAVQLSLRENSIEPLHVEHLIIEYLLVSLARRFNMKLIWIVGPEFTVEFEFQTSLL